MSEGVAASNNVEEEFLWSCTLTSSSKEYVWAPEDPADDADEEDKDDPSVKPGHRLLIKSAILMPTATKDDISIIQVETEGYNKSKVVVPMCAMKAGTNHQQYIDLLVPHKAIFKLIQGEGPISLVGSHCVDFYGYRDVGAEYSDNEETEEESSAEKEEDQKETKSGDAKKESPAKVNGVEKRQSPAKSGDGDKKTPEKSREESGGSKKRKASEEKTNSAEKKAKGN